MLVTNFGLYGIGGRVGNDNSSGHVRIVGDWGLLGALGRHSAAGVSFLASLDDGGMIVGPALRYHRWSSDNRSSLEVAGGVAGHQTTTRGRGDPPVVFGLIKWNQSPNIGLSLRPEWRRAGGYTCTYASYGYPPYSCSPYTRSGFALSVGIEIGGVAGMVGAAVGAILGTAAIASSAP